MFFVVVVAVVVVVVGVGVGGFLFVLFRRFKKSKIVSWCDRQQSQSKRRPQQA